MQRSVRAAKTLLASAVNSMRIEPDGAAIEDLLLEAHPFVTRKPIGS